MRGSKRIKKTVHLTLAFAGSRRRRSDPSSSLLPLGLLSIAAVLRRAGHRVRLLHLGQTDPGESLRLLLEGDPDLVGFSCFTFQRHQTMDLARALRRHCRGARPVILLGGPHAGPLAREILERCPAIDGVVVGEGEFTLLDIANRLQRGQHLVGTPGLVARHKGAILSGPLRPWMDNLDRLPLGASADASLLGVDRLYQLRHLVTARGCSSRCIFCCAPSAWGKRVRRHSIDRVCAELKALRLQHGLIFLSFRDDTFTADLAWTKAFCRRLVESGSDLLWDCQSRVKSLDFEGVTWMRRAGCIQIQLGIESGSEAVLRTLRKPFNRRQLVASVDACRRAGMLVSFYLITGVPGETDADIDATEQLVTELRPSSLVVSRLSIYPGTPLADLQPRPASWFESRRESFFVREDTQSRSHFRRLQTLARRVAAAEPYSRDELIRATSDLGDAAPVLLSLGQLEERLGLPGRAEQTYRRILDLRPGYPWAELHLGELLLESGRSREAVTHLGRVVRLVPRWPHPLNRLGWALILSGQRRQGEALLEQARRLEPTWQPAPPPVTFRSSPSRASSLRRQRGNGQGTSLKKPSRRPPPPRTHRRSRG